MPTVLIATRNKHKVEEIRSILGDRFEFRTLSDFPGAPTPVEDAPDFAGNATKKAVTLANWLATHGNLEGIEYVLADDSGLEVDALNGAPGVHSARFAGLDTGAEGNSSDAENNAKLLRLTKDVAEKKARFRCVIAFTAVPGREVALASKTCEANEAELGTEIFDGRCEGRIIDAPRGARGFGYDPLFIPDGFNESFAELGEETKNRISHRSRALEKLRARLDRRDR
ncbi:MAG TPA: non-canonical purine NTP pyrophosphatase [Verrucomicrobiae bacterium]